MADPRWCAPPPAESASCSVAPSSERKLFLRLQHELSIAVTAALATQPALIDAVAEVITGGHTPVTGSPGPFRSPARSQITRHRRHALVCRGPRGTAYGANEVAATLGDAPPRPCGSPTNTCAPAGPWTTSRAARPAEPGLLTVPCDQTE